MRENGDTGEGSVRVSLAEALTFHASFDHGPEADFGLGDPRIYSVTAENGQETGELLPGLGQPALTLAEGQGRFGCFRNQGEWDVTGQRGRSEEFFFRLVKVAEPPFAKGQWTHVAITWNGLNTPRPGRARLYLNAEYKGATSRVDERFTWDVEQARIRLGTGHYVGLFDDLACFNRPFSADEVRALYELETGVAELHMR